MDRRVVDHDDPLVRTGEDVAIEQAGLSRPGKEKTMKRLILVAALLGMSTAVPALASESDTGQPVTLTEQQLDSVRGGDLLNLNLSALSTTLNTVTGTLQSTVNGLNGGLLGTGTGAVAGSGGLLGNGNLLQPINGLLNTATVLLGNLGL
jgi:hypothetical protein